METLHAVSKDHAFATFLEEKFNSSKRFGIEGCESVICGLQKLVTTAVEHGVKHVTVGMAHRGRLSTIYNIFNKPAHQIFEEFMEKKQLNTEDDETGDVKYHLGYHTIEEVKGKKISLELVPNPSHL